MKKLEILTAVFIGGAFATIFLIASSLSEDLFLRLYPSTYADDVRFDLTIPVYGTAYLSSVLVVYVLGKIASKLFKTNFTTKTYLRFVLRVPFLYLAAYLVTTIVFLIFFAIGFHNESLDVFIVYVLAYTAIIWGYFYSVISDSQAAR